MKDKRAEIDQIFLWILLAAGLLSLLIYGLTTFFFQPSVEIITTHPPGLNSNNSDNKQNIKPQPHQPK
jgi:hypothetical protein